MGRAAGWSLLIFVAVCSSACADGDVVTNSYANVEEARRAGAFEQGWIPLPLPAGAHDIREAHGPASGRRWGLFNFTPADDEPLRRQLGEEIRFEGLQTDPPGRIEWWPVLLRGPLDQTQLGATGLRAYRSMAGEIIVAVNWPQRRAYYWSG